MPILINNSNKEVTKLGKLDELETKQYSTDQTIGTEEELNKYTYEVNETENTVTLQKCTSDDSSITIYSKYRIGNNTYSTIIENRQGFFEIFDNIKQVILQDGIVIKDNMGEFFEEQTSLEEVIFGNIDTSSVIDMHDMFYHCTSLTSIIGLEKLNTSNVSYIDYMFKECTSLTNVNLSNWDTSNVNSISKMFEKCTSLTNVNLSNWDTSNLHYINQMFNGCTSLTNINLSNWDISSVYDKDEMFNECNNIKTLVTPKVGRNDIELPFTMLDDTGTEYTTLPTTSKTLYKGYHVTLNTNGGTINNGNIAMYPEGEGATLPIDVTRQGYTFEGWYDNSECLGTKITKIGTEEVGDKTYYAKWKQSSNVPYKVKHYKQQGNTTEYTLEETEILAAPIDTEAIAIPKQYEGYIENTTAKERKPKGIVLGDGSLELVLIYDTIKYTVTFMDEGNVVKTEEVVYGTSATAPKITKEGYVLSWDKTFNNVTSDLIVNAVWLKDTEEIPDIEDPETLANYKVEHYKQNVEKNGYDTPEIETKQGKLGTTVTAEAKQYQGFNVVTKPETIESGTVIEDGSLTLKLYYDRNTYTVTFNPDGGTINEPNYITEYTYGIGGVLPTDVTKQEYTFWGWYDNAELIGNIVTQITDTDIGDKTYYANWIAKGDTPYKVLHYKQVENGYVLAETENLTAQTDTIATAIPKNYVGYTENVNIPERIPSGTVAADGSLELKLYYDQINYTIVFKDGETVLDTQTINYGESATAPTITKEGYILSWDKDFSKVTSNLEVNAVWTKIPEEQAQYKIEHYVQTEQGKYILKETENLIGNIGDIVTAQAKTYEEYILDETNKDTIKTGEIKENEELVLKLYYNYKKFEVIFKDGDKEVGREEVIYGGTVKPPVLTKPGYILSWDKDLNNITKAQTINAVWTKDPNYKDGNEGNTNNNTNGGKDDNTTINKTPDEGKEEQKPNILPKTGEETLTLGSIMILLGIAIVYFVKYKF